jgi:hypothetical protein
MIPENCKLVAAHTGEGWSLEVHGKNGETVALLAWPESWPSEMMAFDLKQFGFECV